MSFRNTMGHSMASGFGAGLGWAAASAAVRSIGNAFDSMSAPSTHHCIECKFQIPPSATITCTNVTCQSINSVTHTHCSVCHTELLIPCPQCQQPCQYRTSTTTKMKQGLSSAGTAITSTATQVAASTTALVKAPRIISCERCSESLIVPPRDSYTCIHCRTIHADPSSDEPTCTTCHGTQKLSPQQIICHRCTNQQIVPSIKLAHDMKKGWNKLRTGIKKVAWSVSHTPYVACPRCTTHVKLADAQNEEKHVTVEKEDGDWNVVEKRPSDSHSRPASSASSGIRLNCPSCDHRFTLGGGSETAKSK